MSRVALSSALLSLAWFAAVNVFFSLAARVLVPLVLRTRPSARADALFALRLMPAAMALLFVGTLFLPAHLRFEPGEARESFGVAVWVAAVAGAWLLAASAIRLARVAIAGWRLRACASLPRLAACGPAGGRVYEVDGFAGVLLTGVLRPRILVGRAARLALTAAELDAAIAHERAHHRANDNLKRLAIHCAPDWFGGSAAARRLEARWRAAVEWTADACAAEGRRTRAIALASALVKVAQLEGRTLGRRSSPVWSTLHEAALLDARVRRLVGDEVPAPQQVAPAGSRLTVMALAAALAGLLVGSDIHRVTELLVRVLP